MTPMAWLNDLYIWSTNRLAFSLGLTIYPSATINVREIEPMRMIGPVVHPTK